jgi:hypothetical protein
MFADEAKKRVGSLVLDWKGDARRGLKAEEGREKGEGETEEQEKIWRGRRGRRTAAGLIFSGEGVGAGGT